ncbi:hypothetical protein TBLA_0A06400 [Henningerozyma blattae CBS 6284]|uniref:Cytochrome c oxidase subunit 8, mitochondrial n=1 Tax=Henningerozyma blattae (strain ATCC 34711 / CBS 6284 / DSM 70876 / NBRC 10599 / NRRL Y-10934 / UCD 77-7) TaxID=1071380 RepID=I2GWC9_HENB6|nr:hypothetical protein TBLA_0A06400 [Tetrapisispora blattae CBS 6284]CCH58431.1 hypothetical protein TBLA_0A06400 [Tetrapisispora blattae CBS 6284]
MLNQVTRLATRRAFSQTARANGHFAEGVYSNIPFKVHNRKIPYGVIHFGFFTVGFSVPFLITWAHLKRSGF